MLFSFVTARQYGIHCKTIAAEISERSISALDLNFKCLLNLFKLSVSCCAQTDADAQQPSGGLIHIKDHLRNVLSDPAWFIEPF